MPPTVQDEIDRFLRTGRDDAQSGAWSGDFLTRERAATRDLKAALVAAVHRKSAGRETGHDLSDGDHIGLTRRKVAPMVRGFFPSDERDPVLNVLERSVVFVTAANISQIIEGARYLHTAWIIANLYLGSVRAGLLGPEAPALVGLSEETTCYLSTDYWRCNDHFADFLVHEAAHIFHNCKRTTVGLRETRTREFLLNIDFGKRETFAYACEAYGRILELSASRADRRARLSEHLKQGPPSDDRMDADQYIKILVEAVEARNGWKRILAGCAPQRSPMDRLASSA